MDPNTIREDDTFQNYFADNNSLPQLNHVPYASNPPSTKFAVNMAMQQIFMDCQQVAYARDPPMLPKDDNEFLKQYTTASIHERCSCKKKSKLVTNPATAAPEGQEAVAKEQV